MSATNASTDPTNGSPGSDFDDPSTRTVQHVARGGTTGDQWKDLQLAIKKVSIWDDLNNLGSIPCARNSLLSGIASGVGMGAVRGISASPFVACNWAVGTFLFISWGTWTVCQRQRREELQRMQQIVEEMPRRRLKRRDGEAREEAPSDKTNSSG